MEINIGFIISGLISNDLYLGGLITTELSFKNHLNLLSSLLRYRLISSAFKWQECITRIEKMNNIIIELNHLEEFRNKIIHSWYMENDLTDKPHRIKTSAKRKNWLKIQSEPIESQELLSHISSSITIMDELNKLAKEAYPPGFSLR